MQNADGSIADASDLSGMFGTFCVTVFDNKNIIEDAKVEVDFKAIHKSMSSFIKIAQESEKSLSFDSDANEVIYMMCAIADEVFLNMNWDGKQYWEENMLEQRFFGTQIAGDEIFNRINDLMLEKEILSTEKSEIYLKLLSLGFKGKYRDMEDEQAQINSYRTRLLEFIEKNDDTMLMVSHRLFQKEYTYTIPTIHRKLLPSAAIINYVSAFFIFMFLVISSVVWVFETRDIRQLLTEVSGIALRE